MEKKTKKVRLDQLITDKGLAPSRSRAQAFIMAGMVKVNGQVMIKAGAGVDENSIVELTKPDHPYVSRGGLKLERVLDQFGIDVAGKTCLDAGASTGGFTDCLLQRGAGKVYAADVGYGQIALKLREDPRVIVIEKCNVRYLSHEQVPESVDLITADLSFISLEKVIPRLVEFLKPGGIFIPLIKPQFEADRKDSRKGVVRDDSVRLEIVEKIREFALTCGMECLGTTQSPITGPKGNVEYLGYYKKGP